MNSHIKNIRIACMMVITVLSGWSCNDYFELKRPVQYPWQTVSELELAVREGYLQLSNSAWESPLGALTLVHFGQSDIAQLLPEAMPGNSYAHQFYHRVYTTAPTDKEVDWCFKYLYYIITSDNAALQLLEDAEANATDPFESMVEADRELVKRFSGELYFTRAVAYWYLARIYAPPFNPEGNNDSRHFVLRTKYVNKADELKNPPLGSVAEVWKQIQDDLEKAKGLLPESYVTSEIQPKGRANRFAASAMLMRVYFITGQHAKAEAECDYILGSDMYNLFEDPIVSFNRIGAADAKEVIWEIPYTATSTRFDRMPGIFGKNWYTGISNYSQYTMAYSALKNIGWMTDGQNNNFTEVPAALNDKRYTQLYKRYNPGEDPGNLFSPKKAHVWIDKYFRSTSYKERTNRPMIRLAEIYLTRSILRFKGGNKEGAAQDVNEVRRRAGLSAIPSASLTAEDIHNERIKELACEHGDRVYYLIGLRLPLGIGDRDPAQFSPVNAPYSDYYWKVPLLEQQQNQAYHQ